MVNRIIEEIQKSLKQENYLAALTMALTLPDICGKAAEPFLGTGARYKNGIKIMLYYTKKQVIRMELICHI